MGTLLFAFATFVFLIGLTSTTFVLALLGILVLFAMVIIVQFLYFYLKESISMDRHPPIAGLLLNQLIHFHKVFDYHTALARKHSTFRLIEQSHSEIYTADPVNVEYILRTNFPNYIKVINFEGHFPFCSCPRPPTHPPLLYTECN